MKTSEKTLKNFVACSPGFPVYQVEEFVKKELTGKDCYYLRYCLMQFIFENKDHIFEYVDCENEKEIFYNVDQEASIGENSLYIGNFEGYAISEEEVLKDLEMSEEGRVILNIYNTDTDTYKSYLID